MKKSAVSIAVLFAASWCVAQRSAPATQPVAPPPQEPIPTLPAEPLPSVPSGARVVASPTFTQQKGSAAEQAATEAAPDLHRDSILITSWDLQLLLRPATHNFAARGKLTVRNDDKQPRTTLPLQISSSLNWQAITIAGKRLAFTSSNLTTGFDHTGLAHEANIQLPQPLQPGAQITLDVLYEGAIPLDATRLEQLGAPPDTAENTDWDRIDGDFTGIRGMGDVLWFPVSAEPVMLGDGARLFTALGQWKARHAASTMTLHLRVDPSTDLELTANAAQATTPHMQVRPSATTAIANGIRLPLSPDTLANNGTLIAELPSTPLGFSGASIFLTGNETASAPGLHVYSTEAEAGAAQGFPTALNIVRPTVEQWLAHQSRDIAMLSLPRDGATPFETQAWWQATNGGPLLALAMPPRAPEQVTPALADALAHASFLSFRPWLSEGVAEFLSTIWAGHGARNETAASLELLESRRPALTLAEPANGGGQPLISATDDIFYRTKAAYVLWMLRGMCGDEALSNALKAYRPAEDKQPEYFERLIEAASHKDLAWFFADWVYADHGLPELKIANVLISKMETAGGSWLVTVDVENDGYAGVEVPVRVDASERHEEVRLHIPARGRATAHVILHAVPTRVTVNDGIAPETSATVHVRDL